MFTGLIEELGKIEKLEEFASGVRITVCSEAALIFWFADQRRFEYRQAEQAVYWKCSAAHGKHEISIGRCLWNGSEPNSQEIREKDHRWGTFAAYKDVFQDSRFSGNLTTTLTVTFLSTFLVLLMSLGIGIYQRMVGGRIATIMTTLTLVPLFVPVVIAAWAIHTFYAGNGFMRSFFSLFGIDFPTLTSTVSAIAIGSIWTSLPFAILMVQRDTDAVGRFGGEEFVILCEQTDEEGGKNLAERIRRELEATTFQTELGPLQVTCSVGVAPFPTAGHDWATLFKATDEALYVSKREGRNRVTVWRPNLRTSAA